MVASLITVGNLVAEEEEMQAGEGERQIAQSIQNLVNLTKRKEGIMTENEKLAMDDANGGLTTDELLAMDNG